VSDLIAKLMELPTKQKLVLLKTNYLKRTNALIIINEICSQKKELLKRHYLTCRTEIEVLIEKEVFTA
jgi:hypothetical protein